ncbi:MAG: hypothetical protein M5U16_10665 [Hyphomicrobium sp.]|nr:hypothetical protein [Hyphomicrobium sp.]
MISVRGMPMLLLLAHEIGDEFCDLLRGALKHFRLRLLGNVHSAHEVAAAPIDNAGTVYNDQRFLLACLIIFMSQSAAY